MAWRLSHAPPFSFCFVLLSSLTLFYQFDYRNQHQCCTSGRRASSIVFTTLLISPFFGSFFYKPIALSILAPSFFILPSHIHVFSFRKGLCFNPLFFYLFAPTLLYYVFPAWMSSPSEIKENITIRGKIDNQRCVLFLLIVVCPCMVACLICVWSSYPIIIGRFSVKSLREV